MDITVIGITYSLSCFPIGYFFRVILSLSKRTPSNELYFVFLGSTNIDVIDVQSEKASDHMYVTESGMVTDARDVQPENANHPISVKESGSTSDDKRVHP